MKICKDAPYIVDGGYLPQILMAQAKKDGYVPTGEETSVSLYLPGSPDSEHDGYIDDEITNWILSQTDGQWKLGDEVPE